MSDTNQDEFQAALATEFDFTPEVETPATPPTPPEPPKTTEEAPEAPSPTPPEPPKPADDAEKPKEPAEGEPKTLENGQPPKQETAEEKANREATEAANAEPPKPLTPEDIQAAIRADREETQGRVNNLHAIREDIIKQAYPEGVEQKIYDSNGNVIKTAQDIVDRGLVNERTNEPYTYEEAASFMLEAGRQMQKNMEELNQWAETVAEENINLLEGNQRVMTQWGDVLKAMPKLADELAEEYITTQLQFDETKSYITKMNMSPEAYYARALAPYKELGKALVEKQELEAKQAAAAEAEQKQNQENEQAERFGLPPQRGESAQKSNTGDPFMDALVDELNLG